MRRATAHLVLAAALLPAALLVLARGGADEAAMRCAIACGHAMGAAKGAVCCPMEGPPDGGPAWKVCPESGAQGIASPIKVQPALLVSGSRLLVVRFASLPERGPVTGLLSRPASPPDHVPISLS